MSSFDQLLSSFSKDPNTKVRQFEHIFAKWFFENDPAWKTKVAKVWHWKDYPLHSGSIFFLYVTAGYDR